MKFDTKDLNPGAWFTFPGKGNEGKVCLRVCDIDVLDEIQKQTRTKGVEYKKGQRFEFHDDNPILERALTYDYCIMDWKNINDAEGKPIPCNYDMKKFLMGKSVKFSSFVADCLTKLSEDEAASKVVREKN